MAKSKSRIGDVFCATLTTGKKYLQYVANDRSQLDSEVIRVFKKLYPLDANPNLAEVVRDEVEFYAHVFLRFARKLRTWDKVGNIDEVGRVAVLFRDTNDYGKGVPVSHDWWIWRINEKSRRVGKLEGSNRNAEVGIVVSPPNIVHRMQTGAYGFVYPRYE